MQALCALLRPVDDVAAVVEETAVNDVQNVFCCFDESNDMRT